MNKFSLEIGSCVSNIEGIKFCELNRIEVQLI